MRIISCWIIVLQAQRIDGISIIVVPAILSYINRPFPLVQLYSRILELNSVWLNSTLSRYMLTASGKNDIEYLGRNIIGPIIFPVVLSAVIGFLVARYEGESPPWGQITFSVTRHINK